MLKLLLFTLLLLATPAWAESWSGTCQFASDNLTPTNPTRWLISNGVVGCYRFVDSDSTSTSDIIIVQAESALVCFDPDNTDALTDTARVTVHRCVTGVGGGTGSVNTCVDTGGFDDNATLDGTEGPDRTQNACKRVGPGAYFIRVTAACTKAASNYCEVSIKGEGTTN